MHLPVVPGTRRRHVDIVFTRAKIAVFVDGCFWHGCPEHSRRTVLRNAAYWTPKIAGNIARDADTDTRLVDAGWVVVRVWEHDCLSERADAIESVVRQRRKTAPDRTQQIRG